MTPRQAAWLKRALEARWPEASDVEVTADSDGARIRMTVDGTLHLLSVADGGPLLRLFLLDGLVPRLAAVPREPQPDPAQPQPRQGSHAGA